jgi:DNA-binding transcriptional regulator YhcF (GntR family)
LLAKEEVYLEFFRALKESRDRSVIVKAKPLNTIFLLNTLAKQDIVNERINTRLREALVVEKRTKSALYIAKERNSFATLYGEISRAILKPALEKLPKEGVVREMIKNGLEEYREEK